MVAYDAACEGSDSSTDLVVSPALVVEVSQE